MDYPTPADILSRTRGRRRPSLLLVKPVDEGLISRLARRKITSGSQGASEIDNQPLGATRQHLRESGRLVADGIGEKPLDLVDAQTPLPQHLSSVIGQLPI